MLNICSAKIFQIMNENHSDGKISVYLSQRERRAVYFVQFSNNYCKQSQ